jgi:hypothetical protein
MSRRKSDSPREWGDTYTWLALDSETKLILSYHVGKRDGASAFEFVQVRRSEIVKVPCGLSVLGFSMPIYPDYGLRLVRQGYAQEVRLCFRSFSLL